MDIENNLRKFCIIGKRSYFKNLQKNIYFKNLSISVSVQINAFDDISELKSSVIKSKLVQSK